MAQQPQDETAGDDYRELLADVSQLLERARQGSVRAVNSIMTVTYGRIGQRLVEQEQRGSARASYGEELVTSLAEDLTARFGRGFSRSNLFQMRQFYLSYRDRFPRLVESTEAAEIVQTPSGLSLAAPVFPLSWSHYTRLLTVVVDDARQYYEMEALRGG